MRLSVSSAKWVVSDLLRLMGVSIRVALEPRAIKEGMSPRDPPSSFEALKRNIHSLSRRYPLDAENRFGKKVSERTSEVVTASPIQTGQEVDFLTFGVLLLAVGANEHQFQTGWFIESLFTQVLVVLVIRTRLSPFWHSRPSKPLTIAIIAALGAAVVIPLSPLARTLGFAPLPPVFWGLLIVLVATYLALVEFVKRRFEPPRRWSPKVGSSPAARG